ncbi:unnamed protein product [Camellia sinensis]
MGNEHEAHQFCPIPKWNSNSWLHFLHEDNIDFVLQYKVHQFDFFPSSLSSLDFLLPPDDNHERNCQTKFPSEMENSFWTILGESISNFPEKETDEEEADDQPDEKLEPGNYKGEEECQGSQINCSFKPTKPFEDALVSNSNRTIAGKSISNVLEKDINEDDVLLNLTLSTCRDEKSVPNNHKRKSQSYQRSQRDNPSEMEKTSEFDVMTASQSICIIENDALPDEELQLDNHRRKCLWSQSNYPSKMMKPFDVTTDLNLNEMVMSESICNFSEKDMIKEDAEPDSALSKHGDEKLSDNHKRKYQSCQSNYPSKTKKTFDQMPASNSDVMITSEIISNFPKEGSNEEIALPGSSLSMTFATRTSSSIGDQITFLKSEDSHVKLRIKSFTVPEFFVEIPETATMSILMEKVMEKATAIVGGAHVGVLQGEKIRDENETLSATDISNENRLDVILEPIPSQAPHSCPLQLPCDISQPLTRYSPNPVVVHQVQGTSDTSPDPLLCNLDNDIQGDHDLVESQTNKLIGKNTTSMEVIAFPATSVEQLDVSSVHQKSDSSKNAQRRKSEVFSKSEVEALVQAVEELGTGRWTKIREQAFGNASKRTHTDLKDKWRSLVRTAKRPVNKRRGVVLPQELLHRVLAVETHNSLQQAIQP